MRAALLTLALVVAAVFVLATCEPPPPPDVVTPAPTNAPDSATATQLDSLRTLVDSLRLVSAPETVEVYRTRLVRATDPLQPPPRYATLSDSLLAAAADSMFRASVTQPAE